MPGASSCVAFQPQPQSTTLDVEFVQHPARLHQLAEHWHELWSRAPDATPFQSPDWLLNWRAYYGEGPLCTFAFWSGERLVGFAPLYIYAEPPSGFRRLFFIGTGNTDYLDVIVEPFFRHECLNRLFAEIDRISGLWDECDFERLRSTSPLLLNSQHRSRMAIESRSAAPCPAIDLRSTDAPQPMLKKAAYCRRRLEKKGLFAIESATPESLDEMFNALERLHQSRWRTKNSPGVLSSVRDQRFQRAVAHAFLAAKMLRLYALRIDQEIIAVLYGFRHRKRTYFYLSGFDPAFANLSVGTVILAHAVEEARCTGCETFDFLKGREAYKYKWGARDQAVFGASLTKMSCRNPVEALACI